MAKFITVLSGKGGVGKTTSTINIGLAMSKLGGEVIVLDGNLSSPNLTVHLGSTYFPVTIHDVMVDSHPIQNAVYQHHTGLKIIPADVSVDAMRIINFEKLKAHLQDLHLLAEYVLVDGSPGLGKETTHLIDISDEVIIVTNPDHASLLDAKRMIEFVKKFNKTITGLMVTKYKDKKHKASLEEIEKFLGMPVITVIPEDHRFEKSLHHRLPYIHLYPARKASKAYHKLAKHITGRVSLD